MTAISVVQLILYFGILLLITKPLGSYMAKVFSGERTFLSPALAWLERGTYKALGVDPEEDMKWTKYGAAMLWFSVAGFSRRPHLILSDAELTVDGGICDRWRLPWDQIDAIAPPPEVLRDKLTQGSFVLISLRARERRKRRPFSTIQHSRHHDHFGVSGYYRPVSSEEASRVVALLNAKVNKHEPMLLADW